MAERIYPDYRLEALEKLCLSVTDSNGKITFIGVNGEKLEKEGLLTWNVRTLFDGEAARITINTGIIGVTARSDIVYYYQGAFMDAETYKPLAEERAQEKNIEEREKFLADHDLLIFIDESTLVDTPQGMITACTISFYNKTKYEADLSTEPKPLYSIGYKASWALITQPEVVFHRWKANGEENEGADVKVTYLKDGRVHEVVVIEDVLNGVSNRRKNAFPRHPDPDVPTLFPLPNPYDGK